MKTRHQAALDEFQYGTRGPVNFRLARARNPPDEIYHLGAQSHVRISFDIPEYTGDITALGTTRLLHTIRETGIAARFYNAASSEMFGQT